MSADFTKVLVKDDRLDVTSNIKYAVVKGGQNVTCAQFQAISQSNSQLVFNIQVPSEQTIIDRRVLLQTDLALTVTSTDNGALAGARGCRYAANSALAPFPLHQLMSVASATINNNTVSVNVQDVLPAIMRMLDHRELSAYNGYTPTYQDTYANYVDGVLNNNNPNAGYFNSADPDVQGRGSVVIKQYSSSNAAGVTTENFVFRITEPLLISPFIFGHPKSNAQGFYGVQNLNFIFNVAGTNRVFRGPNGTGASSAAATYAANSVVPANTPFINAVTLGNALQTLGFANTQLLFTFLTPHPSDLMPARNIVPYYELPRYITSNLAACNASAYSAADAQSSGIAVTPGASVEYSSQSLQLNQIPDKLIVMVRKVLGSQNAGDPDSCLPIDRLTINFNNNSGILASATKEDLYRMSRDNGSQQNWYEFSGNATEVSGTLAAPGAFKAVPTVGSFLVLEFGKDIQLVEDFYAPGSLGNFNIQVKLTVHNQNYYNYAANQLELVLITMNSGVFVNERGTSSTYTGILTKADVLEASEQVAYTHSDVKRMIGGGFLDMIKSAVQKVAPVAKMLAPVAKDLLSKSDNKYAQMGSQALGAMGFGASGAGVSGGGGSGGRRVNSRLA
jgi:hypothetical protein